MPRSGRAKNKRGALLGIRHWLEDRYVRQAADLADELADDRGLELGKLLERLETRREEITSVEARLNDLQHRLGEHDLDDLKGAEQVEGLLEKLDEQTAAVAEERGRIETVRAVLAEAEVALKEQDRRIAEQSRTLDADQRRIGRLETLLAEKQVRNESLRLQTESLRDRLRKTETREPELSARESSLRRDAEALKLRSAELAEREDALSVSELSSARVRDLDEREVQVERLELAISDRDTAAQHAGELFESEKLLLEQRQERLRRSEEEARQRDRELDKKAAEFVAQAARVQAEVDLLEDRVDDKKVELATLEKRIGERRSELDVYVSQIQADFARKQPTRT